MSLVLLVLSLLCGLQTSNGRNELYESSSLEDDDNTVLLGGLFPIHSTTDGQVCAQLQDFAIQQVEAMVFAINLVNSDAELLPSVKLAFTIRDTCSNPSYALDQTFQYVQNLNASCSNETRRPAVSGVVGAHFSRVSMDVANLLRLYKVPQISYISTADILSDKSRFDYFFRTVPPDSLQARAIADIIELFNWTYVYAIHSDDSYGNGGIDSLITELNNKDLQICIAEKIPLSVTASPSEYYEAVQMMNTEWVANASVAVLFGHLDAAVGMMKALTAFKQNVSSNLKDLTWIGTDAWGDSLPDEYHDIAHGMLSVIPLAEESEAFDEHFTSLHPSNYTENVWFNEYWQSRFGCNFSEMTCNGSFTLNTTDHMQYSASTLVVDAVLAFAHATQSLIDSECPTRGGLCDDVWEYRQTGRALNGEMLRRHLYNISFHGASSNLVTFDAQGNEPGAYFVKNLQRTPKNKFSFETIGRWDHLNLLNISADAIEWVMDSNTVPQSHCSNACEGGYQRIPVVAKPPCCWVCSACESEKGFSDGFSECTDCNISHMPDPGRSRCIPIPITFLRWVDIWAIALIVITIFGLLVTLSVIVILVVFRNHDVVKASSREVSAVLLLGIIFCFLMPFSFMAMPSVATCVIRRFGVGFSFAVCYSALLVKTNRIHRIFNQTSINPSKPPRFTGPVSQVLLTLLLISVQVAIAVVWLAVELPSTNIAYSARTAELRCGESPVIGLSVSLSYNFLLLVLSTFFAFRARKVPQNFNEAKYINVTLYTLCIVWLAFIPTYFATAKLGAVFQTSSLTIAIILSATTTLACLFIPRIILLVTQLKKRKRNASETNHSMTANNKSSHADLKSSSVHHE